MSLLTRMKKIDVVVANHLEYRNIMKQFDTQDKIRLLNEEIEVIRSQIQEHGTGHLHTAISVLTQRIDELTEQFNKEQQQRNK